MRKFSSKILSSQCTVSPSSSTLRFILLVTGRPTKKDATHQSVRVHTRLALKTVRQHSTKLDPLDNLFCKVCDSPLFSQFHQVRDGGKMNISKAIIGLFLIWISQTATIHSSAVQVDPIASNLSSLFHSRVKRGGYEMKCKQSATGMFSCIKCINS